MAKRFREPSKREPTDALPPRPRAAPLVRRGLIITAFGVLGCGGDDPPLDAEIVAPGIPPIDAIAPPDDAAPDGPGDASPDAIPPQPAPDAGQASAPADE